LHNFADYGFFTRIIQMLVLHNFTILQAVMHAVIPATTAD